MQGHNALEKATPSPFLFTVRLAVSMALFPTCLVTWSLGTLLVPVACHLQIMPICSAVSGLWPRRVSAGWVVVRDGVKRSGEEMESDRLACPPLLAVHNSLSSVLVALTTERDRLRDLHQGSELSRMAVRFREHGS